MSDADFDRTSDPLAATNPLCDNDNLAPEPRREPTSWQRRTLSQALLDRAHARQDEIADAFVDALLAGKISLFRLLIDLEQAAVDSEAEARQARRPTLAEVLLPMLDRERRQAAENAPDSPPSPRYRPLSQIPPPITFTPVEHNPEFYQPDRPSTPPQPSSPSESEPAPGITDIQAAASKPTVPSHFRASAARKRGNLLTHPLKSTTSAQKQRGKHIHTGISNIKNQRLTHKKHWDHQSVLKRVSAQEICTESMETTPKHVSCAKGAFARAASTGQSPDGNSLTYLLKSTTSAQKQRG